MRRGASFGGIFAALKIGVDPRLSLNRRARLRHLLRQKVLGLRAERLFEMTSDQFFGQAEALVPGLRIDAALVDGLHTYDQSRRDVDNILRYLAPRGVVVLHDCILITAAMAYPASSLAEAVAARPRAGPASGRGMCGRRSCICVPAGRTCTSSPSTAILGWAS